MFIFYYQDEEAILIHLPNRLGWHMATEQDILGTVYVNLYSATSEEPLALCSSLDLTAYYNELNPDETIVYYSAVVAEVARRIEEGSTIINLRKIEEQLLPSFVMQWQAAGYITKQE